MMLMMSMGTALMSGTAAVGGAISGTAAALGSALGITGGAAAAGAGATAAAGAGAAATGTAAAGTAAAGAAAGTAAAGGSALASLQGAASALSAFSTFAGGLAAKRASDQAAYDEGLAAKQETIIGQQESNDILDQALNTLARQKITIGASGVSAFSGTARNITREGVADTERAISITGDNASLRAMRRRSAARALRKRGQGQLFGAIGGAAAQGVDAYAKFKTLG